MRCATRRVSLYFLWVVLWSVAGDQAQITVANTHGRPNAQQELQAWFGDAFAPFIAPNSCLPVIPGSGLTLGAFACKGYVRGTNLDLVYTEQPSHTIGPLSGGNGNYWLALHRDLSTAVSGWTRQVGTSYLWQKAVNRPADPPEALIFAQIVVSGGNIIDVANIALSGISSPPSVWVDVGTTATATIVDGPANTSGDPTGLMPTINGVNAMTGSGCEPEIPATGTMITFDCTGVAYGPYLGLVGQGVVTLGPFSDGLTFVAIHTDAWSYVPGWVRKYATKLLTRRDIAQPPDPTNAIVFLEIAVSTGKIYAITSLIRPEAIAGISHTPKFIGNLNAQQYPSNNTARNVWVMRKYGSKVYFGSGYFQANTGPTTPNYIDTSDNSLHPDNAIQQEEIHNYSVLSDNNLYIPGSDTREQTSTRENASFYIYNNTSTWVQHQTIECTKLAGVCVDPPDQLVNHVWSIIKPIGGNNVICAQIGQVPSLECSSDEGTSFFAATYDSGATTQCLTQASLGTGCVDDSGFQQQFMNLNGVTYTSGLVEYPLVSPTYVTPLMFGYNGSFNWNSPGGSVASAVSISRAMMPGCAPAPANCWQQIAKGVPVTNDGLTMGSVYIATGTFEGANSVDPRSNSDHLIGSSAQINGSTYIVYSSTIGTAIVKPLPIPVTQAIDLKRINNKIYVLVVRQATDSNGAVVAGDYLNSLYRTVDITVNPVVWRRITEFRAPASMAAPTAGTFIRAFEYLNGNFYFGASGCGARINASTDIGLGTCVYANSAEAGNIFTMKFLLP